MLSIILLLYISNLWRVFSKCSFRRHSAYFHSALYPSFCRKNLRRIFRKLPLHNFLHSAKYLFPKVYFHRVMTQTYNHHSTVLTDLHPSPVTTKTRHYTEQNFLDGPQTYQVSRISQETSAFWTPSPAHPPHRQNLPHFTNKPVSIQ